MKRLFLVIPIVLLIAGLSYFGWLQYQKKEEIIEKITTDPFESIDVEIDQKVVKKIDRYFTRRNKIGRFNGAVLYADHGKIVYKNAFGYKNMRTKEPLKTTDAFQLASVSKPLTALGVIMLQEKGLIQYDDPIQKYLPEVPYKGVTIRHLLIHKSGVPNYMYFSDELWDNRRVPISNDDVLCLMDLYKPKSYLPANRKYNYSNTNYALLASVIEKVSGKTFEAYMQKYVFDRVGMDNAFIYNRNENHDLPKTVTGFIGKRKKAQNTYLNGVVGDKGIYASVEDLYKLDRALYTDELISQESQNLAFSPAHRRLYAHDNYGFGWRVNTDRHGQRTVYHSGWWKGFKTYFIRELYSKKTMIVLTNTTRNGNLGINELRRLFEDETIRP